MHASFLQTAGASKTRARINNRGGGAGIQGRDTATSISRPIQTGTGKKGAKSSARFEIQKRYRKLLNKQRHCIDIRNENQADVNALFAKMQKTTLHELAKRSKTNKVWHRTRVRAYKKQKYCSDPKNHIEPRRLSQRGNERRCGTGQ